MEINDESDFISKSTPPSLCTTHIFTTMTGQWLYDFCEHLGPLSTYIYKIFSTFHIFEQNPSHMLPETSQMSGVCIMY